MVSRAILSAFFVLAGLPSCAHASSEKPSGPLKLVWTAAPVESAPELIDLTLTVTSRRDAAEITLSIELPDSVMLAEGSPTWTGPAGKGEPVSVQVRVRKPDRRAEIVGRASADFSGIPNPARRSVWTQASSLLLGGPEAEKPRSETRRSRDGQVIRGIPLE